MRAEREADRQTNMVVTILCPPPPCMTADIMSMSTIGACVAYLNS